MTSSRTRVKGTLLLKDDHGSIILAGEIIRRGGLVAFPTETVYGLGASAVDPVAINQVFSAKGRPSDNPLIVHIAEHAQLDEVACSIPDSAYRLTELFWPGPLSLVLQRRTAVIPDEVRAGLTTVAVRMPNNKVALDLIRSAAVPIAAPSANRSGRPSPTAYWHVLEDLTGRIDAVVRSSTCSIGLESTVLDLTGLHPVILRPGGISREELEKVLGCPVLLASQKKDSAAPASPGMKYRHYSPRAPLILIAGPQSRRRLLIEAIAESSRRRGLSVGLLGSAIDGALPDYLSPEEIAFHLYDVLRQMDQRGVNLILAEETESKGLGLAVMNRLRKAAVRVLKV
jgi:L-threonylcarbamoyladenylate synthase